MNRFLLKGLASVCALAVMFGTVSCSDDDKPDGSIAVSAVAVSPTTATVKVGESVTLSATITPDDATDKTITWSSSDEKVATVDAGKVTGVTEGTATITATTKDGNKTATCAVTVSNDAPSSKEVILEGEITSDLTLNAADKWSSYRCLILMTIRMNGSVERSMLSIWLLTKVGTMISIPITAIRVTCSFC